MLQCAFDRLIKRVNSLSDEECALNKRLCNQRMVLAPTEQEHSCAMLSVIQPITAHPAPAPFRDLSEHKSVMEAIVSEAIQHPVRIDLLLEYVDFDDIQQFNLNLRDNQETLEMQVYWRRIEDRRDIVNLKNASPLCMTLALSDDSCDDDSRDRGGRVQEDTRLRIAYVALVARHAPPPTELSFCTEDQTIRPLPRFFVEYSLSFGV